MGSYISHLFDHHKKKETIMESEKHHLARRKRSRLIGMVVMIIEQMVSLLTNHWLFFVNGFFGALIVGALLAPIFMELGWTGAGRLTYTIYSFTCHQLPERSYFFFTPQGVMTSYTKQEVIDDGADPRNVLTLRQYIGSPEMGWKAGFSDRMFSMYGGAFLGGVIYWLVSRKRLMNPIPIWLMILLVLPMVIDGTSHLISEITSSGFRDSNEWAKPIFGAQSTLFYTGTTIGTLNSHLRLVTGLLFGLGTMLFAYPLIGYGFNDLAEEAQRMRIRNEVWSVNSQQ